MRHFIVTFAIRFFSYPFAFLPYSVLHWLGKQFGVIGYFICLKYRKRAFNNIALAKTLELSEKERKNLVKASFQNLMITVMELSRLIRKPHELSQIATCENSEVFQEAKGKGVVLLSSHQANWEIGLFDLIPGSKGVTIGRPLANHLLYRWVLKFRERNGNQIIAPKNALKIGISELRQGKYFAFFGDQAKVTSHYHYPFFGTRAWTTETPALLAYKTNSPLCVISKKRVGLKHIHRYSPLIWPDRSQSWKSEVPRMMDIAQQYVEESIRECPEQWLWQHRRWKQGMARVHKQFRYDFILLIMPTDPKLFSEVNRHFNALRELYPRAAFTALVPRQIKEAVNLSNITEIPYQNDKEIFLNDYSYQLVFDFIGLKKIKRHYLSLGAFKVINLNQLKQMAKDPSRLFESALKK